MRDMHSHFGKSDVRRAIRSLSAAYMFSHKEQRRPLIFLQPTPLIHPDLASCLTYIDYPLPDPVVLEGVFDTIVGQAQVKGAPGQPPTKLPPPPSELKYEIIQGLRGLTAAEAADCVTLCIKRHKGFPPEVVSTIEEVKANILKKSNILT